MNARLAVSPWGAGLDQVAAIRCLQVLDPRIFWLKPRRIETNAWELIRRADWFRPIEPGSVQWAALAEVHLVGVTQGRHIPDLLPLLGAVGGEIITYGHEDPRLPAPSRHVRPRAFSLTAHFAAELARRNVPLGREDALLLAAAIWERTGGGLVSRTTDLDWQVMDWLFRQRLPLLKIGNLVCPGWREGQRGLFNDLLRHMEDLEIRDWPVTLALVRSSGHVQEVTPVVDALWSSTEPAMLVAGVCDAGRARIWVRSQTRFEELKKIFHDWSPVEQGRWLTFRLPEGDPERVKECLRLCLEREYKPEMTAAEIMTSSPRCVEWHTVVADTYDMMLTFNIMGMPVLRDGLYAGFVTRRDVDRAIQMDLWDAPIGPHLSAEVPGISPDTPLRVIRRLMVEHNQTKLAVVAEGMVVGLVTARELLRGLPDPVPLPRRFLPLVRAGEVPGPEQMEVLLKRVFSV
ncbi:MAG TPA: CBS domain-containing protein, partial [Candidatus Ozemobacteraceae bacterium]|nr:CBS domain-containing protein [Candidatus Ozemobacteraceae bacterium]